MNDATTTELATDDADDGWEWAIVEIMGFRKHAGRCREVERFGAKLLRIDIPIKGDPANGWETHFYSGSSMFSYTPTDEAACLKINKPYEPVAPYRLPRPSDDRASFVDVYDDEPEDDHEPEPPIEEPPAPPEPVAEPTDPKDEVLF
jgi:hypothetical protein